MHVTTIKGRDYGLQFDEFIGAEIRTMHGGSCIYIDEDNSLWVQIQLRDEDQDSTDINPFRMYVYTGDMPIMVMLEHIENIPEELRHKSVAYIDRTLIKSYGFKRNV